jgi:tetratricopeptide (TPR) repeat protein
MNADPVPLQSPTPAGATAPQGRIVGWLLAAFVCALAFLLASTSARNSDLWLHLAAGRAIVEGRTVWGSDTFSSTTEGVYWVNSTWLSDVLFYELYRLDEGKALVVAKAVLVMLLAALLLAFRLRGAGMVLFFVAGSAAMVALGPWLTLRPFLLSVLGLLATVYLLERPNLREEASKNVRRRRWLLLPLFALWANLDSWFVLGPLVVGLYALGTWIRRPTAERRSEFLTLGLLALFGLVACLCTPHNYRTFVWPTPLGLSQAERAWRHDPLGSDLVVSSFGARFAASPIFTSPGAWAYYLLLVGGAASFLVSPRTVPLGRLFVWLTLAALSIYQTYTIPFFAVVGAAFLALNLQEWLQTRSPSAAREGNVRARRLRMVWRGSAVLAGLALLVLAWPGWLQPAPYRPRSWTLEPDGSLVRMAQRLQRAHDEGRFRPDRFALTFSPEVANYLAWFCPAEKGFVDSRWPLFDGVVADFVRMRRTLLQNDDAESARELRILLDVHHLDRIVLYDPDRERTARAYRRLFLDSDHWELLAVEGGAALFARRSGSTPSSEVFDYRRAVYRPSQDRLAPPNGSRTPQPSSLMTAFTHRDSDRSPDREEADLHLLTFDLRAESLAFRWVVTQTTGLVGSGAAANPAEIAGTLAVRLDWTLPPSSPEPLLLAVRAARRALAVDPNDGRAFLVLGEAYLRLAKQTREQAWQAMFPRLAEMRHTQIVTALEQAALLRPHVDQPHALLAQLYFESGQMDRALDHLQARLRIAERAVPRSADAATFVASQRSALRADVEKMKEIVGRSEKIYKANSEDKNDPSRVLDRARLAERYNLTRKALELLLASYPAIFGKAGVEMQLDLMLKAGRAYEVRDWLTPDIEKQLDFSLYHWIQAQAAAACGDYAAADEELDQGSAIHRHIGISPTQIVPVRSAVAFRVADAILTRPLAVEGASGAASAIHFQANLLQPLGEIAERMRREADGQVLRGLLALEWGEVETARRHFRSALNVWGSERAAATGGGLDFRARTIAQEELRRIEPRP